MRLIRLLIGLVTIALFSGRVVASCETDARRAFAEIQSHGPYHVQRLEWGKGGGTATSGTVLPGLGDVRRFSDGSPVKHWEVLHNGRQIWTRLDGSDWKGPGMTFDWIAPRDDRALDDEYKIIKSVCGTVGHSKSLIDVYEIHVDVAVDVISTDRLFVDTQSGLPLRRERTWASGTGGSVTLYRYDAAAKLPVPRDGAFRLPSELQSQNVE
jgi:hypothetical protein